jgi:hypothetical protein
MYCCAFVPLAARKIPDECVREVVYEVVYGCAYHEMHVPEPAVQVVSEMSSCLVSAWTAARATL